MRYIVFWIVWVALGYGGWSAWLQRACPHGGCSFMLVAPQLPGLIVPFMVWAALGVAASIGIQLMRGRRKPPAESKLQAVPSPLSSPLPDAVQAPVSAEALMHELGITFDGSLYRFREFRYEKLADAIAYARLAGRRND
jgi:hypothetical protein